MKQSIDYKNYYYKYKAFKYYLKNKILNGGNESDNDSMITSDDDSSVSSVSSTNAQAKESDLEFDLEFDYLEINDNEEQIKNWLIENGIYDTEESVDQNIKNYFFDGRGEVDEAIINEIKSLILENKNLDQIKNIIDNNYHNPKPKKKIKK